TQLFFDNHDFYDFRDRCELAGIHVPVLAGIMPVTSLAGMIPARTGTWMPASSQRSRKS
ncbi:MAG: methylenetetrahydrofolate reductase [NAD(P)H], partial [Verrucomicrobiaceae bacterium]